ncbi:MAG: hypothetical protein JXQ83_15130, partial [Candidatus Glassbacteria bacterium]|nr:hypothetical protein [Candidatus Glassbacteria bacterium]
LFVLAVSLLVHSLTWVWVNADMGRGVRFLDRVRRVDCHTGDGKVQLGYLLKVHGYIEESTRQNLLVQGNKKYRAFLNIGKTYWEKSMPDSSFYYCRKIFEQDLSGIPFSLSGCILFSIAYDSMEKPDSAAIFFLEMKSKNLDPGAPDLHFWTGSMNYLADSLYNRQITEQPRNEDLIMFYLRYFTLTEEEKNLDLVYRHILANKFEVKAWLKFLGFATVCGQKDYLEPLTKEALRQHPDFLSVSRGHLDRGEW